MSQQDEFADAKPQTASGSEAAWSVEARSFDDKHPVVVGDVIFTGHWRTVPFEQVLGGHGVPSGHPLFNTYLAFGLLSYPAAQAMRWWFLAHLHELHKASGIETRLIKHRVEYRRSALRVSSHHEVGGMQVLRGEESTS